MRIGNISQGTIQCDNCKRTVLYSERYLIVKEKNGKESEDEAAVQKRYCVDCATKKGYVEHREEKGNKILTFFQHAVLTPARTDPDAETVVEIVAEPEPGAEKEE